MTQDSKKTSLTPISSNVFDRLLEAGVERANRMPIDEPDLVIPERLPATEAQQRPTSETREPTPASRPTKD